MTTDLQRDLDVEDHRVSPSTITTLKRTSAYKTMARPPPDSHPYSRIRAGHSLSKFFTTYLSPLFTLICIGLVSFTYLGPAPLHQTGISLVNIIPGNAALAQANFIRSDVLLERRVPRATAVALIQRAETVAKAQAVEGPTVRIGLLGSCTKRPGNDTPVCTKPLLDPTYDVSALPQSTPFLPRPAQTSPYWILVSIVGLFIFFLMTAIQGSGRVPLYAENPILNQFIGLVGLVGWLSGIVTVIVLRVTMANAIMRFNTEAANTKQSLMAMFGNGFTLLWVAYALSVPSVAFALFKVSNTVTGGMKNGYGMRGFGGKRGGGFGRRRGAERGASLTGENGKVDVEATQPLTGGFAKRSPNQALLANEEPS
ncbi:hypothetical protein FRB99_004955 [Tulasnella sp. 403]|nr:hypothetical protein FRB99_004955 [Tulasnella sp. 403]